MKTTHRAKVLKYYNDRAGALSTVYDALNREQVHADLLSLLPKNRKLKVLDVGAGSGADAKMFAQAGHDVVAVEPAKKLREIAKKSFKNKKIKWISDQLPQLKKVEDMKTKFNVVVAIGILQYLDEEDRSIALKNIVKLLDKNALLEIQYPAPASRDHQFSIKENEINRILHSFNQEKKTSSRFKILFNKKIPETTGRKALDGYPLFFQTILIKRTR